MFCARHFFVTISLDVTISASCNWSVAVFTTSLESQESYLTLRNVTLQTRLSITRDFFRQHSTFARLYNAAASPASRLRSAGSLAIITTIIVIILINIIIIIIILFPITLCPFTTQ